MIKTIILEGLGCANCASKIEYQTKGLAGVNDASVDFVSKRLSIDIEEEQSINALTQKIRDIVSRIEPDVKVLFEETKKLENPTTDAKKGVTRSKEITKLIIGLVLFLLGLVFSFPNWLELAIFLASYIVVGGSVVLRAIKGMRHGQVFSEHFLMSVATVGAFAIGQYPEGAAVMIFYLVGELLQDMAVDHSRRSITALMDIRPEYANLKVGDEIKKVSPEEVRIEDILIIKPGEKIPLDGVVLEGKAFVDTSALTGESLPRELQVGDKALSGFINTSGVLTVEVTMGYGQSTVNRILDLVQNASSRKAPTESFLTKFAKYYTPTVVFGALGLATIPPLVLQGATFSEWISRALVFLVVSCPCALVISIPLGFFGGVGGASKRGILVKGSNYLEALNNVDTVVFDKTGTLTKGIFSVTEIHAFNGFSEKELLEYAAYGESFSNHPIAVSIRNAYSAEIDMNQIRDHQELAGYGIKVKVRGHELIVGSYKLMEQENISYSETSSLGTVVYLAADGKYAGYLVISDEIKEDSAFTIKELKKLGIRKTVMLTGDLKAIGDNIGNQLGIDEVYSELLPIDKVERFEALQLDKTKNGKTVFVGDGINDAPVLARADIGIAMGGLGSDAAIEAADVVIMTDEPNKIVTAIKIAKRTRRIVFQNIVFALGVKAVFLILGAWGLATMWEAVFGDVGVTLIAIINSMRVIKTKNL